MISHTRPNKQASASSDNECPSQPLFDIAKIDAAIPAHKLSKSWCGGTKGFTFVLGPQPHIAINHIPGRDCRWPLEWFDTQTGVKGSGAVAMVAHVLKITRDEAARRLAEFLALTTHSSPDAFIMTDAKVAA
ncbi:hypothetical protein [Methylocystis parvus]|uniref:Uncharacterized protein n=1 Tax=Methylocystis parvus TaxID=134 RepID=A0A6B8MAM6_9HYPH|nr:hypothetical protein [Methylocystis parvus]QGM97710.1 hypothetical protein F7D14_09680 [Methylocystis parvus]WBJ98354.1 hypothetical protein MMG94_09910 [Methylocystis parvus OBBP]